jgi:muramoyltetrapeptide carboxypeptidase
MIYPKFLKPNQTIGVPAPSCGEKKDNIMLYENSVKTLSKLGYNVVESENKFNNIHLASADAATRAKEFSDMWKNENIHALISLRGGEFMLEILPYLNKTELEKATPKLFQGFSDNTVLVHYLTTMLDVAAIYHYNIGVFGMKRWHSTVKDSFSLLHGKKLSFTSLPKFQSERVNTPGKELAGFKLNKKVKWLNLVSNSEVNFSGRMLGGCLDILVCMCGTEFDQTAAFVEKYKNDGIIWYLETCDLNPAATLRALWQLKHAGWFKYVKGFVFGRPLFTEDYKGVTFEHAVLSQLKDLGVPILANADIGHMLPTIPVVNGAVATVNYKNNKAKITYVLK